MTVVPSGAPVAVCSTSSPPCTTTRVASGVFAPCFLVVSVTCETAAILAIASPLNPSVPMDARSSGRDILLVACWRNASSASSSSIPQPSSVTAILVTAVLSAARSILIRFAPASTAFSTSSFTTDAARSTTSPAAMWLIVSSSRTVITPITSSPAWI